MKQLVMFIILIPVFALADVSDKWEQQEMDLAYNIEFCRITASYFDNQEHAKWETMKEQYLSARPADQRSIESWTDIKKIMQRAKSAENNANRRLESIEADELYVHEGCYEKWIELDSEKPWNR